ncbi:acyl-CoA N-acyltransferase [Coniochaeta sp. 2T2.1]|nr:acyl-CoA N-acyltransferase [Coniochaeta sp. 2T2.1]
MGDAEVLIPHLRDASRKLVREWGFLRRTLADSGLSPAAIHCLMEIGDFGVRTFDHLQQVLKVREKDLEHTIAELQYSGDIQNHWQKTESGDPEQVFFPTAQGIRTLAAINAYGHDQVVRALAATPPDAGGKIVEAFRMYASALQSARQEPTRDWLLLNRQEHLPRPVTEPTSTVVPGYRHGILSRCLEMHITYYGRIASCGAPLEAELGRDFGELCKRISNPLNEVWAALETLPCDGSPSQAHGRIVGTIWIDGESSGEEGVAQLRGFILDDGVRGQGLGRKLMDAAMAFVDKVGFEEVRLRTARQLKVARRMYEKAGFVDIGDIQEDTAVFGTELMIMEYAWKRPISAGSRPKSESAPSLSIEKAGDDVDESVASAM